MRIDSLFPDSDVILKIGKESELIATFVGIVGEKEERIAWFVTPEEETGELFRWSARRHKGRWVVNNNDSISIVTVIRDPRYPDLNAEVEVTVLQYGMQRRMSTSVIWYSDKETALKAVNRYKGQLVKRTVTYGAVIPEN